MYTTTEISKDLVDFRLVLMVVAALNSSLENSKFSLENLKELSLIVRFFSREKFIISFSRNL